MKMKEIAKAVRIIGVRNLEKAKSAKIREIWDYRADGIATISEAKKILLDEAVRWLSIALGRPSPAAETYRKNRYLQAQKKAEKLRLKAQVEGDTALCDVQSVTRANYPYNMPVVKIGIYTVKVAIDVEEDWDYYANSYGRPKTEISNRRVEIFDGTIKYTRLARGHINVSLKKKTYNLTAFRGNWFLNVLGKEFGESKVHEDLKKVQLHPALQVWKHRKINDKTIYSRRIAGVVYDFCAVSGDLTFHGGSEKEAIAGLRAKQSNHKPRRVKK